MNFWEYRLEVARLKLTRRVPPNPDVFRNLLAFFLISAFVGTLPLLIYKNVPSDSKEIVVYMIGQLSGMATTALAFYFTLKAGEAALDAKRAENTGKMADAVVAAANASPPVGGDGATEAAQDTANAAQAKANMIADAERK